MTNLRKKAESLSYIVRNEIRLDRIEKSIFIFCSKNRRKIAIIANDSNGYIEITKKLECLGERYC